MDSQFLPIPGSSINFQGTLISHPDKTQTIFVELHLRPGVDDAQHQKDLPQLLLDPPHKRKYLSHKELTMAFGASDADAKAVMAYFKGCGIKIVKNKELERTILLSGTIGNFETAFSTTMGVYQGVNQTIFLAYKGALCLPSNIQPMVLRVAGMTEPIKLEFRLPTRGGLAQDADAGTTVGGYPVAEVAKAYGFPSDLTGKGQCIAIIELGGEAKESDFKAFFKKNKIKEPEIISVGQSLPSKDNLLNNTEVTIDVEIAGAIAPGAKLVIYYANSIADAMKLIIADTKNKPTVVSISWAGPESNYNSQQVEELNQLFYEAAVLGMTVIAASGDHGAYFSSRTPNVALPSSNPYVLGCGGTIIDISGETITSEIVWNEYQGQVASGGGFSSLYPMPYYQSGAVAAYPYQKSNARGVPDVAADAGMKSGYQVIFNGKEEVIGGTSASTPVWAALIALLNEGLGYKIGFANAMMYEFAGKGFRQIVSGNNNYYKAAPNWNPCTGLGSPHGQTLLDLFRDFAKKDQAGK